MLLRKPKCLHPPLRLVRRPLNLEMPQDLRDQFAHFHDGDNFTNAGPGTITELLISYLAVVPFQETAQ
jgi:hypothetical protein